MKKGVLYLLILLTGVSCNKSKDNQFQISGTIAGAAGEMIFLDEILQSSFVGVDSTIVSDDGTFKLTGHSEIPAYYSLRLEPSNSLTLIIYPGEKVVVKAEKLNLRTSYEVSGSNDSELLKELDSTFTYYYEKLQILGQRYDTYKYSEGSSDIEAVRYELDSIFQVMNDEYRQYIMNFIDENLGSMACFSALFQAISEQEYLLNPYDDYEYFKKVDSILTALYPSSGITRFMNESMLQVEEQREYMQQKQIQLSYGSIAPEIALPSLQGDTIKLSSLRGKYVLLDFWASWCAPCRQENPNLLLNYKKFARKNFTIFQVSLDRDKNSWKQGIIDDQLGAWYHVSDLLMWNSVVVNIYNLQGIPTNYLLDKEGRIIAKDLRGEKLEQALMELLNK